MRSVRGKSILIVIPITAGALGTWQVIRYQHKQRLIEKAKEGVQQDPLPWRSELQPKDVRVEDRYRKYYVIGRPESSQVVYIGPKYKGQQKGYYLVSPYTKTEGGERILVNYGWLAETDSEQSQDINLESYRRVTGFLSPGEPGWWWWNTSSTAREGPHHWLNVASLSKMMGTLPVLIESSDANSRLSPILKNRSDEDRLTIPNNHLQYIITWYSISAATMLMWLRR